MTTPLTDDDLGARLRSALQEHSPLATDPVPPPRFAPDGAWDPAVSAPVADAEVLELHPGRARPRRSRRVVAATSLLVAAAAAVTAVAVTSDLGRGDGPAPVAPAASTGPTPLGTETIPGRDGAYLGITPDPDPWRCTAPAGTTIAAIQDPDQFRPVVWTVAAGVTCVPFPHDRGQFAVADDGRGVGVGTLEPAYVMAGGGERCAYATTFSWARELSAVSRGEAVDYVEFYGPGCRLVLPSR